MNWMSDCKQNWLFNIFPLKASVEWTALMIGIRSIMLSITHCKYIVESMFEANEKWAASVYCSREKQDHNTPKRRYEKQNLQKWTWTIK